MSDNKRIPFIAAACLLTALLLIPQFSLAAPPSYTLTTAVVGSGSVNPSGGTYNKNATISIAAIPASGWQFDHWEGYLSGSENPTTIRFTSNVHVIAVFVEGGTPPTPTPPPDPTATPTPGPTPTSGPTPPPGDKQVVGYFIQWGIYRRGYTVKNIVTSGSADVLTVVNYAFAGIDENLRCAILDPFADYNKAFDASESVDGVADVSSQTLKGNFNQLRKLKMLYPNIRVVISIGGWSESDRFSDAALPENRAAFVSSCVDMFIHGNFSPADGVVGFPGIFDGIDIDWEYPGACGETCNYRPEDTQNFTALMAEFRSQLDAVDPNLLLTIAAPSSEVYSSKIELAQIHQSLDWINLMTYDFHGGWEPNGPTNHHANLYTSPADPSDTPWSADASVQSYLAAGVPAAKLTLGIPFYGRGWSGVPNVNHGLYQSASRLPRGVWEKGVNDYDVLQALGYPSYWDPVAQAHWIFNGSTFWTYDDAASIANKMAYVNDQGLLGVMFWELTGDDDAGTLVQAIGNGLQ